MSIIIRRKIDNCIICRAYLRSIYNSLYMLGMLFGSLLFGWISDTFGRINSLMAAIVTTAVAGFLGYRLLSRNKTEDYEHFVELFAAVLGAAMATVCCAW